MRRFLPIVCLVVLMACQDKVICPAFQSTYILDDSTRNAYYSYVWQLDEATRTQYLASTQNGPMDSLAVDSLTTASGPKTDYYAYAGEKVVPWRVRGRTKYGIVKYEPYWLKKYRMRTAPMENVFAPKKEEVKPEVNYVASSVTDSLSTDSLSVASLDSLVEFVAVKVEEEEGPKYRYGYDPSDNFNVEQEYYNKHFGQLLIDTRPKPEPIQLQTVDSLSIASEPDSLQRKGLKGLFKKKKNQADSTATTPVVEDSDDE